MHEDLEQRRKFHKFLSIFPKNPILCRWVRGICEAIRPLETLEVDGLVRLWAHEALRLFQDRLGRPHHISPDKNMKYFSIFGHFLGLPVCRFSIRTPGSSVSLRLSKKKRVGICVHLIYASKHISEEKESLFYQCENTEVLPFSRSCCVILFIFGFLGKLLTPATRHNFFSAGTLNFLINFAKMIFSFH
jgi:hypothetical protein